ncbi:gliding-motility protein MglA [Candidatus Fermentibacteria bacterium]|nr:MAG: gliding-motility protein MglA [Candidatus Fermentibacteria bacterium]PIE52267.1 MAG: gliding-motility protein MglA [Candidatus Fermentibacteria bacterium]PIE52762.1 MAG: gliding-motility protein MglA [Candidatus Fermentibacteria bacterium]
MHKSGNEIAYKIVYYGPGLSGKTTNLRGIRDFIAPENRGRLVTLCTRCERTVFFDFLPVNFARIGDSLLKLHLYSVPGQAYYALSRRVILDGVDGIVFVADSQQERVEANLNSMDDLEHNLKSYGIDLLMIPMVLQFNKRDLPGIMDTGRMNSDLNRRDWPTVDSVAMGGSGPAETLKIIATQIARRHARIG